MLYHDYYGKCIAFEKWQCELKCISTKVEGEHLIKFGEIIPLFNEGQLRKFIEDNTNLKVDIQYCMTNEPHITLHDIKANKSIDAFDNLV